MSIFNKQPYSDGASDWNTPASVWDIVLPFIPKDKVIWLPFYNDGYAGNYLRSKGFNIIHNADEDFWKNNHGDCVIDNPPYKCVGIIKTKEKIIKKLIEMNKPFMLLVPTTTMQTQYFKKLYDQSPKDFQLVVPQTKYNFEKSPDETEVSKCPFYTLWICWNMNFDKDFILI